LSLATRSALTGSVRAAVAFTGSVRAAVTFTRSVRAAVTFARSIWAAVAFSRGVGTAVAFARGVRAAVTFAGSVRAPVAIAGRAFAFAEFRHDAADLFSHRFGFDFELFGFVDFAGRAQVGGAFPSLPDFVFGSFQHLRCRAGLVAFLASGARRFAELAGKRFGLFHERLGFVVLPRFFQLAGFLN
jgi:hypothetical protein